MYRLIVVTLILLAVFGCKKEIKVQPSCNFVQERKLEFPNSVVEEKSENLMMLFSVSNRRIGHCFALFCKIQNNNILESVTISWVPNNGGTNLDMPATINMAKNIGTIQRYGPYSVKEDLYNRAKFQEQRLRSGQVKYKVFDNGLRPNEGTNSVHAISDILCNDKFDKFLVVNRRHGNPAAVLKTYFYQEGFISGNYKDDSQLQSFFGLQGTRRVD